MRPCIAARLMAERIFARLLDVLKPWSFTHATDAEVIASMLMATSIQSVLDRRLMPWALGRGRNEKGGPWNPPRHGRQKGLGRHGAGL